MNLFALRCPPGTSIRDVLAPLLSCRCGRTHDRLAVELMPFIGVQELELGAEALALSNCACGSTLSQPLQAMLHDTEVSR